MDTTDESYNDAPGTAAEPGADTKFEARPWHGALNPFEALYQHFTAEIAKLSGAKQDDAPPDQPDMPVEPTHPDYTAPDQPELLIIDPAPYVPAPPMPDPVVPPAPPPAPPTPMVAELEAEIAELKSDTGG